MMEEVEGSVRPGEEPVHRHWPLKFVHSVQLHGIFWASVFGDTWALKVTETHNTHNTHHTHHTHTTQAQTGLRVTIFCVLL